MWAGVCGGGRLFPMLPENESFLTICLLLCRNGGPISNSPQTSYIGEYQCTLRARCLSAARDLSVLFVIG